MGERITQNCLKEFEDALADLIRNIKFRKRSRPFFATLKKEISRINKQKHMIIPSDKTSNNFLVPAPQYKILLDRETQKDHKRGKEENVEKVNVEHGKIVKSF